LSILIYINGAQINVNPNFTVLQACGFAGIYIPRFCYHEKLSIAGSCRVCLVELYKSLKPIIACATPIFKDMEIYTETALTRNSREHVLEFLLINHPLDCPICDQGGECDLQDQSLVYGSDRGRFKEKKRAVINKEFGPFIKTMMTRCIHCTRCVRFMSEIAGDNTLGTLGRGKDMEIGTYIKNILYSEISGNIIDICPVGALTSKPFAFTNRAWELRSVESVDILDGLGSSIRLDFRGSEIVRVLPMVNESYNEHWITDKIRFSFDGFKYNRLITPLLRKNKWSSTNKLYNGYFTNSWEHSIFFLISILLYFVLVFSIESLHFFLGELIDIQTTVVLMKLSSLLGSSNIYWNDIETAHINYFNLDIQENYLLNIPVAHLEQYNSYLFLGSDLQLESPLLNIRLNKVSFSSKLIVYFGSSKKKASNGYHLGLSKYNIQRILEGKHFICKQLSFSNNILWISNIFYSHIYKNFDYITNIITKYTDIINKHSLIHNDCNKVGFFNICMGNQYKQISAYQAIDKFSAKLYYCLGNVFCNAKYVNHFIIYQGHHSILNKTQNISLFLPSTSFIEKNKKYINNIGKLLTVHKAVVSPGLSKDDVSILSIINTVLLHGTNKNIKEDFILFTYLPSLFSTLLSKNQYLHSLVWYIVNNIQNIAYITLCYNILYAQKIDNYYNTNQISLASKVISKMVIYLNNYIASY